MQECSYPLNMNQIQQFLPHRAPFLLVDRILEISQGDQADLPPPYASPGTKVIGIKNVSYNEPYFQGHFPGFPVVPGVLIIETMAQVACFAVYPSMADNLKTLSENFRCVLVGVDNARFRKPVVPGDTMRIEVEVTKCRGKVLGFQCSVLVEGQKVAEAELLANISHVGLEK